MLQGARLQRRLIPRIRKSSSHRPLPSHLPRTYPFPAGLHCRKNHYLLFQPMKPQAQQTLLTFPGFLARLAFLAFFSQKNEANEPKNKTNPTINVISGGRVVVTKDLLDFALVVGKSSQGRRLDERNRPQASF